MITGKIEEENKTKKIKRKEDKPERKKTSNIEIEKSYLNKFEIVQLNRRAFIIINLTINQI